MNICTIFARHLRVHLEYSASCPATNPLHAILSPELGAPPHTNDLEGVVFRRDLVLEEAADEGDALEDVLLHSRDGVEEEEGEDACCATHAGCQVAAGLD